MKIITLFIVVLLLPRASYSKVCFYTKPIKIYKLEGCSDKICVSTISCLENGILEEHGVKSCKQTENDSSCPTPSSCLSDDSYPVFANGTLMGDANQNQSDNNSSSSGK